LVVNSFIQMVMVYLLIIYLIVGPFSPHVRVQVSDLRAALNSEFTDLVHHYLQIQLFCLNQLVPSFSFPAILLLHKAFLVGLAHLR